MMKNVLISLPRKIEKEYQRNTSIQLSANMCSLYQDIVTYVSNMGINVIEIPMLVTMLHK